MASVSHPLDSLDIDAHLQHSSLCDAAAEMGRLDFSARVSQHRYF
jgi:hypothetical protein